MSINLRKTEDVRDKKEREVGVRENIKKIKKIFYFLFKYFFVEN